MKILVIGSEGFIGQNCCHYFSANHFVFQCDIIQKVSSNYFFLTDFATDISLIIKYCKPDICINASGSANVSFSITHPEKDFELNVTNVQHILDAIRLNAPRCKFINFSSAAIYGNPKSLPIKESDQPNPLSPYGNNKLASEHLLLKYFNTHAISCCSVRIFSVYGIGQKKLLFWDLFQKMRQGNTIEMHGTGNESRDFIYIEDLSSALDLIIHHAKFNGNAINIANGEEIAIKKATDVFLKQFNWSGSVSFIKDIQQGYPLNWQADISTLKNLGFKPKHTLEDGLIKYSKWLKERI